MSPTDILLFSLFLATTILSALTTNLAAKSNRQAALLRLMIYRLDMIETGRKEK